MTYNYDDHDDDLDAENERLRAENEALRARLAAPAPAAPPAPASAPTWDAQRESQFAADLHGAATPEEVARLVDERNAALERLARPEPPPPVDSPELTDRISQAGSPDEVMELLRAGGFPVY